MPSPTPLSSGLRGWFDRAFSPAPTARRAQRREDPPATAANSSAMWPSRFAGDTPEGSAPQDPFPDQRLQLADEVAIELMARPELRQAPAPVQDFLLRHWSLVIAHAQLQDRRGTPDPGGFLATVDELLWSVRRDATLRRPSRLTRLVPRLLRHLREGLALLGSDQPDAGDFFEQLEKLHRPVLKLCELRRQESLPFASESLAPASCAPPAEPVLPALRQGSWISLYSRHRWVRARLEWVDPQGRQFLFASAHGGLHALSRRLLERLEREGHVRLASSAAQRS